MKTHLLDLNKYLTNIDRKRKEELTALNAIVAGLVSGGFSIGLEGTRRLVANRKILRNGGDEVLDATGTGQTFVAGAGVAVSTVTIWDSLSRDISGFLTGQIKSTATSQAQLLFNNASDSLSSSIQNSQLALDQAAAQMKVLESADAGGIADPNSLANLDHSNATFVPTAAKFADSMFQIRKVSTELLRTPSLIDAIQLKTAGSSGPATRLAIQDNRDSNNQLMKSLQAFDNAGQSLDVSLKRAQELANAHSSTKLISVNNAEESLEPFFSLMLHNMDSAVDELSNQRRNYKDAMKGIQTACSADQQLIYDKWGTEMPFLSNEDELLQAYLAKTILARADCVHKRSMVRSTEMMKIATTLAQLKGNCTQIKTWDSAVQIYPKIRARIK